MPQNKEHLFANQLKLQEKEFLNRPEFIYRMNRNRFTNLRRVPTLLPSWNLGQGWILKGFLVYSVYYILFPRRPVVPHWNREGYEYDYGHHSSTLQYLHK